MAFPSWTGTDGYPLSWAHFIVGIRRLALGSARTELRMAAAARAAQFGDRDWKGYVKRLQKYGGLR